MTATDIAARLTDALGVEGVSVSNLDRYAVDGIIPSAVASPATLDETASVVAMAARAGVALVVRGGGTAMGMGSPPERLDVVLSTRRLRSVLEHEPADLTATVQAGTTVAALNARLAEHGQTFPLDVPSPEQSSIGGALSANLSGPHRMAYGTARDLLLGLKAVDGQGIVIQGGGKVVKNVAGYDLPKLFVGAAGSLGVIVEATLKLAPLPSARACVIGAYGDLTKALEAIAVLRRERVRLTALDLLNWPGYRAAAMRGVLPDMADRGYFIVVDIGGAKEAVERRKLRAHRAITAAGGKSMVVEAGPGYQGFWRGVTDMGRSALRPAAMVTRTSARFEHLERLIHGHEALAESCHFEVGLDLQVSSRVLRGAWWNETGKPVDVGLLGEAAGTLRKAASIANGPFVIEACPTELKRAMDVWGDIGPTFPIMRRLKERFDPKGIMSPGRYVGGR